MDTHAAPRPPAETHQRFHKNSIVPSHFLSHGTLCVKNLEETRKFYEEFLGLEVVRHNRLAMCFRLHNDMRIVCVEVKETPKMDVMTHWGVDVLNKEDVGEAYANAVKLKDVYGMQKVTRPHLQHGVYAFFIQDRDNNWWEVQHTPEEQTELFFGRGDMPDLDP